MRTITINKLLLALAVAGCSVSDPESSVPAGPVTSSAGLYVGEFEFQPSPPEVGENTLAFHVEATGAAVVGADVQLESYMPAHGHASGQSLGVSEIGDGNYETSTIVYNMPGTWELTIEISAGAGTDTFVLSYDVR